MNLRLWFDCALGSLHVDPSIHMLLRACLSLPVMCWKCNTEMNHSLPATCSRFVCQAAHKQYSPQSSPFELICASAQYFGCPYI